MAKKKLPDGVIEADLCALLAGKPDPKFKRKAGAFPHALKVVRSDNVSAPIILRVEKNCAEIVSTDYGAGMLREFVSYLSGALSDYNVPFKRCRSVVESWARQVIDLRELPKSVAFKGDPELAMARLDFDPNVVDANGLRDAAPHFFRMLQRISNADAFVRRIGSFYDPRADRKQAIWVSGPGDAGKSIVSWLIERILPGAVAPLNSEILASPFWKSTLVGKRAAVVQEAAASFIRTPAFKSLTGDAVHLINPKGEKIYNARLDVMFCFFSNEAPEIPRDDALIKRIIDCRMAPIPVGEERYGEKEMQERLEAELPYVAGYCVGKYAELAPGGRIPCLNVTLDDAIASYEGDYLALLEGEFVAVEPDEEGRDSANQRLTAYICRSDFVKFCTENGHVSSRNQSILKRVLKANFGVVERKLEFATRAEGVAKRLYVYWGIRRRTPEERQFFRGDTGGTVPPCPGSGSRLQVVENP